MGGKLTFGAEHKYLLVGSQLEEIFPGEREICIFMASRGEGELIHACNMLQMKEHSQKLTPDLIQNDVVLYFGSYWK